MGTQTNITGSIIYFVLLFIVVSLFSIAGVFTKNEVVTNTGFSPGVSAGQINTTRPVNDLGFGQGNYFKDIFSFFVWNINIYEGNTLMEFFWIIRIIFVYLPLLFLMLSIYYSLPTITGGG